MTPHKHAELIKAWADGAEIQERYVGDDPSFSKKWSKFDGIWDEDGYLEYRINPKEPVKRWLWAYKFSDFDWELVNELLSDDEAAIRKAKYPQNKYMKLSWSETEFDE